MFFYFQFVHTLVSRNRLCKPITKKYMYTCYQEIYVYLLPRNICIPVTPTVTIVGTDLHRVTRCATLTALRTRDLRRGALERMGKEVQWWQREGGIGGQSEGGLKYRVKGGIGVGVHWSCTSRTPRPSGVRTVSVTSRLLEVEDGEYLGGRG